MHPAVGKQKIFNMDKKIYSGYHKTTTKQQTSLSPAAPAATGCILIIQQENLGSHERPLKIGEERKQHTNKTRHNIAFKLTKTIASITNTSEKEL